MDGAHRADRRDLRSRQEVRRADLSRRGARRRPVRPARRRHRRARRRHGTASTSSTARSPRASASWAATSPRSRDCCDAIRSYAAGFIFTTSLAPALAAGALATIRHLKVSGVERARHQERAATLKARLAAAGLPVIRRPEPHRAGDRRRSGALQDGHGHAARPLRHLRAADQLSDRAARHRALRLTPSPAIPTRQMDHLVAALTELWPACPLSKGQTVRARRGVGCSPAKPVIPA